MKLKCTNFKSIAGFRTAVLTGEFNGKQITLGLSDGNTTMEYFKTFKSLNSEGEIDDDNIQVSPEGRYFISRISSDKFRQASEMKLAIINNMLADKRMAEFVQQLGEKSPFFTFVGNLNDIH